VSKSGSIVVISCQHAAVSQAKLLLRLSYRHHSVKSVVVESVAHEVIALRETVVVGIDSKGNVPHVHHVEIGHKASGSREIVLHVHRERTDHKASDSKGNVHRERIGHRASNDSKGSVLRDHREQIDHRASSDSKGNVPHVHREQIDHKASDSKGNGHKEIVVRVHHASHAHRPLQAVRVVLPVRRQRHRPHKHRHLRVVQLEPPRANRGELSHVIGTITYKISSTASRSHERPGPTRLHALLW